PAFDRLMLGYMALYYEGDDLQSRYYRSVSDPTVLLSWHQNLIVRGEDDVEVFEFQEDDPCWFTSDGSTRQQLIDRARQFIVAFGLFIVGFEEYLKAQRPPKTPKEEEVLIKFGEELEGLREKRRDLLMKVARQLALERDIGGPDKMPPTPDSN